MDTPLDFEDLFFPYIVGIDLGTTNSAVAYVDRTAGAAENRHVRIFEIPQLTAAAEVGYRPILPSFLYLPGSYELPEGSTALPWDLQRSYVVGELAREQGALVPGRLVSSAKSWLCHAGVDRTAPILPWVASADVEQISPVEATARYLQHIKEAWNESLACGQDGRLLEHQMIVLTVPASFDEVARELTITAARQAGLPRVILVEEPLAAFYAWLSAHEEDWQREMRPGQLILICDVGGGTTDFTIVAIEGGEKGLRFNRLAVGDHLMLGGDNMDLTLARHLEIELLGHPGKLDSRRWYQLCHQCRKAKESLLGDKQEKQDIDISIMGSGGRLIADTLRGKLTLAQIEELILEGFFPLVSLKDRPRETHRSGLAEWGLPYVQDPAITRHLAAFWQDCQPLLQGEAGRSSLYPDFLLFNGAALTPSSVRDRIRVTVQNWVHEQVPEAPAPRELPSPRPELAVAIGAAYYGLVRLGEGVRVAAGSPRAYYVEVKEASDGGDTRGMHTTLCLVSRGIEEGFETQLDEPPFRMLANQPVAFQLFSSSTRLGDSIGEVVTLQEDEISRLPPIRTVLRYGKKGDVRNLPVRLAVRLTEIGTLELWCQSLQSSHRWQLQFDVRQQEDPPDFASTALETLDMTLIERAQRKIRKVFQSGKTSGEDAPQRLVRELASILELPKGQWPTTLIRNLADSLLECKDGRTRTPHHESRWLNLLGFCLRPGFGHPLDDWRLKEVWRIYRPGLYFAKQAQCRSEWWIFWRRLAGGLSLGQQRHIYQQVCQYLRAPVKRKGVKNTAKRLSPQEELELWLALSNFERLPAEIKVELGRLMLQKIQKEKTKPQEFWALSRLGARIPLYGPADKVIPSQEASVWLTTILTLNLAPSDALAHALVQLARLTGDRQRDLPQDNLDKLSKWLENAPRAAHFQRTLHQPDTRLTHHDQDLIFGEALPPGLTLSPEG